MTRVTNALRWHLRFVPTVPPMKDHYAVLGLLPNAEAVVVKAAYKALAQRYCSVAFCLELKRLLARMTFCRMSRALLVQMKGLGCVLW